MPNPHARHAPATARNREPILAVLRDSLPTSGLILEIASGTGEHVRFFAESFPQLEWQPSDPDPDALSSIAAWSEGVPNIRPPLQLDARDPDWPIAAADAMLCINMVHISPWAATEGLFAGAARLLPPGAPLYLYGPYRRTAMPTAPSNEAFDESLKARDPAWGLRQLDDVIALAERVGLRFERLVEMPANNLSVIFRRL
ncbi:hypothetical protein SCH01S_51_00980 [Sphingomonas changbaiensis NBRC 104936]|uniref:Methyltransferase n=1 Tax=Sphingomonas changbaiensis NBRC 104936 TaxID=1219043 RepID=A0A0E9MUE4_9SPHN|nr:DUF938 domain-containing protein [Sphingomonas changbaiensis]GAO40765.1 hypothetical protein SCH01S_51_00980 [Sphingomonas changbaiensis NBRC 104936]